MELFRGTPYEYFAVAPEDALVFTAGACPLDSEGRVVAVGDHQGQARQALANLRAALAEAGSGFDHVLKSTVYVVAAERAELVRRGPSSKRRSRRQGRRARSSVCRCSATPTSSSRSKPLPSFIEREIPEAKRGARLPPKGSVSRSSHLPERPIVREWAAFPCSLRSSPRPRCSCLRPARPARVTTRSSTRRSSTRAACSCRC